MTREPCQGYEEASELRPQNRHFALARVARTLRCQAGDDCLMRHCEVAFWRAIRSQSANTQSSSNSLWPQRTPMPRHIPAAQGTNNAADGGDTDNWDQVTLPSSTPAEHHEHLVAREKREMVSSDTTGKTLEKCCTPIGPPSKSTLSDAAVRGDCSS